MTDASSRAPKQYIVERVRDLLALDPRVGELDIHVKVLDDRVFVRGAVPTAARRDVIADVLHEELSDYEIVNEVTVVEVVEPGAEEQLS